MDYKNHPLVKMSFIGLKGGLKGTGGDIQITKQAGLIVFLPWKKKYPQMAEIKA